jgi:AraC family transcriptional regulator
LYIERHLDEPLSLETLSAIAHSSPYHFHRQFSAIAAYRCIAISSGCVCVAPVGDWRSIRRIKIIDIALDAGFQNPESFSRAFRSAFAQSPASSVNSRTGRVASTRNIRYRSNTDGR